MMTLRFIWLGLIVLHFVPGFSGMFNIETTFAVISVGVVSGVMNEFGLIPGTQPYELKHRLRRAQAQLEIDRIESTRTRLRTRENREIERILALEERTGND